LWKLPFGIDFKGGTLIDIQYNNSTPKDKVQTTISDAGVKSINISEGGDNSYLIRTEFLDNTATQKLTDSLSKVGEYKQNRLETVGPTVSNDLKTKAIISVIVASLAIIIFIAIAFRKVPKPANSWRFGVCAVIALTHDLLFVIGAFAILGHFYSIEINSLFITALLTIMGFSVHDTIVVFDRIRENLRKSPSLDFETNVNNSILQTINRSLNTSFTVLIVLLSLFLLGGETLKPFMLALLIGITIGTYSSIFNAPPLLVSWQAWSMRRNSKKQAS
jgi:preprotein translocase subunit SecF